MATIITSEQTIPIDEPFKVSAGPGAGKTFWITGQIRCILKSGVLRPTSKVVCITYTNAAVDVIAERLSKDTFIIPSTIHSFAWNAIKQYQNYCERIPASRKLVSSALN